MCANPLFLSHNSWYTVNVDIDPFGRGGSIVKKHRPYAAAISLAALLLIAAVFLSFGAMINRLIERGTRARIETYAAQQKTYI